MRHARQQRHRLEILGDVVGRGVGEEIDNVGAPGADADGVAVGRRTRHAADAGDAAGAAQVLDQDRLAECRPHQLDHDADRGVDRAAGRERNNDGDRLRRIALRMRGTGCGQHGNRRNMPLALILHCSLDIGGLDDRPPFVGLGLLKCPQRIRRLLLARRRGDAEIGEALTRLLMRQRVEHRGIELRDNVLRRVLRRPQCRTRARPGSQASRPPRWSGCRAPPSCEILAAMAKGLTAPALACAKKFDAGSICRSIWPATRSCSAGPLPR